MSEIKEYLEKKVSVEEVINNPTYGMFFNKDKFKTPTVHSFEHDGMKIDAVFETAYEEDKKGYICHRLNLIHDKKAIEYLKVFYLPKEVYKKMNPDLIHAIGNLTGKSIHISVHPKYMFFNNGKSGYWKYKNEEQKQKTLESLALYNNYNLYTIIKNNEENLSQDELYKKLLNIVNKKTNTDKMEIQWLIDTHLDKPIIEFSKIKSSNQKMNQRFFGNLQ